ncbi:MAG: cob(I)yrinic acid a,c-diamide adenosyltransferase [Clostridiales bacterium]|nr:cob(I)yrinic acid a,c-diamide adenosyltransferase [Clostridiales bacterium]
MDGSIQVYYGDGRGKTTAALGLGIRAAGVGKQVIMVQFLKCKHSDTLAFLKKLEPNLQIFRFAKAACAYSDMNNEERQEQLSNIRMALGYTKKVLDTGQCDLLILDEILGLVDYGIISMEELNSLLDAKNESMDLILTGRIFPEELRDRVDCIYSIHTEKENNAKILTEPTN